MGQVSQYEANKRWREKKEQEMNITHTLINNACHIEVMAEHNKFTEAQKQELLKHLDKFANTKSTNIFKFSKNLKAFEDAFIKFGGDHARLEESIKNIRDGQYLAAAKAIPGIKIVKKE